MSEKSIAPDTVPIRRKFLGKRWDELTNILNESATDEEVTDQEAFVHRLGVADMGLYGFLPETDRFYAVVCDCGAVVKPQGLKNHLERNHTGASVYSGNGGVGGNFNHSGSTSPASSTSSSHHLSASTTSTLKNPEDFSGIIPVGGHRSGKHKYGSSKQKSSKLSKGSLYSSSSQPPLLEPKSASASSSSGGIPEFVINATSNSLDSAPSNTSSSSSSTYRSAVPSGKASGSSNASTTKKSKHHRHKTGRGIIEYAGYDANKHCGVLIQEENRPCLNNLSCRVHTLSQRRQVKGRIGSFDSLLAEQNHFDIESNSSSCSSILEKPNIPDASDDLNNLIKSHIEMPTIVLRKIDEDIKNLQEHGIMESLHHQHQPKFEEIKLEPIVLEAEQILNEIPPAELAQLLQHQATHQNPDDIFLDHQESQMMCDGLDDEKVEIYHADVALAPAPPPPLLPNETHEMAQMIDEQQPQQQQQQHHITCRTVAFPLYLLAKQDTNAFSSRPTTLAGEHDDPAAAAASSDAKPSSAFVQNVLQLQNFVPLFRDTYCDIFSKFEPNILNDATNIFPTLTTVDDHSGGGADKMGRYDDHHHRSIKSCMYPSLPKPSHVNTFGMRRIGGGATISRRSYYLRKTLLKNRENDKKLKLKTDPSGFSTTCQPNQHLLTSSSAVNKAKKRSFLANASLVKFRQSSIDTALSSSSSSAPGGTTSTTSVSELNQSTTDLNKLTNNFAFSTNNFNHSLNTSSSLDDILQSKRPVCMQRYT